MENKSKILILNKNDNVGVALSPVKKGDEIVLSSIKKNIAVKEDINPGFKICIKDVPQGEDIFKYGHVIGIAKTAIHEGEKVHVHNLESRMALKNGKI
ncbi:MAG TPA: UxaA family hydrolase [Candidatus Woesearchaeota archaeon]|nr:UxaA family hydrolase [Candidatus Woesearchaeota archaeon]